MVYLRYTSRCLRSSVVRFDATSNETCGESETLLAVFSAYSTCIDGHSIDEMKFDWGCVLESAST
jgi:hypothetical protein